MRLSTFNSTSKPQQNLCCLIIALALALGGEVAIAQTDLPADAKSTCAFTKNVKKKIKPRFARNGSVVPPDNVNFPQTNDECLFFKQAEQMFLWVTSRASRASTSSYVFNSSPFYAVSPLEGMKRMFIAQDGSNVDQRTGATVAVSQRGPDGERVLFADTGVMHIIVQVEGYAKPVMEKDGQKIEIGRIEIEPDKLPLFYDTQLKPIDSPILRDIANGKAIEIKPPPGNTILSNGQRYLLDQSGRAVAVQPGQADDHVLMAQGDKLVYYMIHVNDVYAYFLTGRRNHKLDDLAAFPTSREELERVKKYARDHGRASFPDESALIVELKSSWIELPNDKDYDKYVWIRADVPDFKRLSDGHWQQKGLRPGVKLAMVGMHVAFSVKGHPELIWSTFEHVNNTPNARYRYDSTQSNQAAPSRQKCGKWLFASGLAEPDENPRPCNGTNIQACGAGQTPDASGMCVNANHKRMYVDGGDIYAYNGETIGPSDILRISPWGNSDFRPTPNASIISINKSIRDRLPDGDVRKNYSMVGAIWLPNQSLPGSGGTKCEQSSTRGSNCLANSTMETFQQPSNCLLCHHRTPNDMLGIVSHVYAPLNPLFLDAPSP